MPLNEEHCLHSEKRYGVRGDDIHTWMDEPSSIVGACHRKFRHSVEYLPIAIQMFENKYGKIVVENIFLDHLKADNEENLEHIIEPEKYRILRSSYGDSIERLYSETYWRELHPTLNIKKINEVKNCINIPIILSYSYQQMFDKCVNADLRRKQLWQKYQILINQSGFINKINLWNIKRQLKSIAIIPEPQAYVQSFPKYPVEHIWAE